MKSNFNPPLKTHKKFLLPKPIHNSKHNKNLKIQPMKLLMTTNRKLHKNQHHLLKEKEKARLFKECPKCKNLKRKD